MSRLEVRILCCLAALCCVTARSEAQTPGAPRPAFSPYLNLLRPGSSTALNYYGLVRPQFQALSTFQSLEQQAAANRQAISDASAAPATGLPTTGHTVSFLNTAGYFMSMNPGQGGGSQSGFGFGSGPGANRVGSGQIIRNNRGTVGSASGGGLRSGGLRGR